jgi:hypothetical protein
MANGYDKEYSTMYLKEVDYLKGKGIIHSFVKSNEYGNRIYKYTKTKELFKALVDFYN